MLAWIPLVLVLWFKIDMAIMAINWSYFILDSATKLLFVLGKMQKKMIFDISGSSKFESVISSLDIKTIVQCEYFATALHTSHINHFLMKLRFYIRICYSSLVHVRLRHYMSLHVSWTWHVTVHMFSSMWGMAGMHDYYISEFKSCFGSTVSSQYNLNKHWTTCELIFSVHPIINPAASDSLSPRCWPRLARLLTSLLSTLRWARAASSPSWPAAVRAAGHHRDCAD